MSEQQPIAAFEEWVAREYPQFSLARKPGSTYANARTQVLWDAFYNGVKWADSTRPK